MHAGEEMTVTRLRCLTSPYLLSVYVLSIPRRGGAKGSQLVLLNTQHKIPTIAESAFPVSPLSLSEHRGSKGPPLTMASGFGVILVFTHKHLLVSKSVLRMRQSRRELSAIAVSVQLLTSDLFSLPAVVRNSFITAIARMTSVEATW